MSFHSTGPPGQVDAHRRAVFLGPRCTGKTSLIERAVDDIFKDNYTPTIESHVRVWQRRGNQVVSINIIDSGGLEVSGDEDGMLIPPHFCVGIDVYVLVYSVASRASFVAVQHIFRELVDATGLSLAGMATTTSVILVGMKADVLQSNREVTYAQGDTMAREWGCKFLECSAKSDVRVILQRQMDSSQPLSVLSRLPPWADEDRERRGSRSYPVSGVSESAGPGTGVVAASTNVAPVSMARDLFGAGDGGGGGDDGGRPDRIKNFGNCLMVFEHLMDTCQNVRPHHSRVTSTASSSAASSASTPSTAFRASNAGAEGNPHRGAARSTASSGRRPPTWSTASTSAGQLQGDRGLRQPLVGNTGRKNDGRRASDLDRRHHRGSSSSSASRGRRDGPHTATAAAAAAGSEYDEYAPPSPSSLESHSNSQSPGTGRGGGGGGGGGGRGGRRRRSGVGREERQLDNVVARRHSLQQSLTLSELYPSAACSSPLCYALCNIKSHQISSSQQRLLVNTTKAIAGVTLGLSSVAAAGAILIFSVVSTVPDMPNGEPDAGSPGSGVVLSLLQAIYAVLAAASAIVGLQSVASNRIERGQGCLPRLQLVLVLISMLVQLAAFTCFVVGVVVPSVSSSATAAADAHTPGIRFFRDMLPEGQSALEVFFVICLCSNVAVGVVSGLLAVLLLRSIQPTEAAPYSYDDASSPQYDMWSSRRQQAGAESDGHVTE